MKHKVADLEGALLDAAVAKANGSDREMVEAIRLFFRPAPGMPPPPSPSQRWEIGGPIIEREGIALQRIGGVGPVFWSAKMPKEPFDGETYPHPSATPLVAAMRAYVASRFGDEVEL